MYNGLFITHSLLRYFVLASLIVVIVKALLGLAKKQPYGKWDNILGLYLFIFTHMQLLIGLILYFISPFVKFGSETMSDKITRYWTVEHLTGMVIAILFITLARTTSKRMTNDAAKHRRMFIFNTIACVIIIGTIVMSGRGLL
ncbi:MAG: cytochrome B [Cyclobacteriaceae bacterium]|jgi:hypothetical protein|nr:cytochrome B [Cyclobacteriaceae bacterium]MDH4296518.1 cytochrome B [Cyclobacteriaceae bacterium]MDH5248382.1 cytochrome B [Cyclobacteriaceae bacterium]